MTQPPPPAGLSSVPPPTLRPPSAPPPAPTDALPDKPRAWSGTLRHLPVSRCTVLVTDAGTVTLLGGPGTDLSALADGTALTVTGRPASYDPTACNQGAAVHVESIQRR